MAKPKSHIKEGEPTPAGLLRGKNRLMYPYRWIGGSATEETSSFGQPLVQVGDLAAAPNGPLTAGVVGKVISCGAAGDSFSPKTPTVQIQTLDGEVSSYKVANVGPMTPDQVQEVIAMYADRPERIKYDPFRDPDHATLCDRCDTAFITTWEVLVCASCGRPLHENILAPKGGCVTHLPEEENDA